jgi:hypothetical protein
MGKKINTFIPQPKKEEQKDKLVKYSQSGHYIDQKLKTSYKREQGKQMSLWDSLLPATKEKLKEEEVIVEGIKLSEKEEQTLNGVLRLLHEKSDTQKDSKNKPSNNGTYYKGNLPAQKTKYGGKNTEAPKIKFKASELYRAVTGKNKPNNKDIAMVKDAIMSLENKKFLIAYNRYYKQGKETKIDRIEEYQPLIKLLTFYEGLTPKELKEVEAGNEDIKNQKGEVILMLNPVFIDQIDTKFIEFPVDVNKLTKIARGGGRVHIGITNLRDYLLRAISSNKGKGADKTYIDKENLPYILGLEQYIKQRRKKLINIRIEESIETCKNLNLITDVKETTGARGQAQYEFTLNLDY